MGLLFSHWKFYPALIQASFPQKRECSAKGVNSCRLTLPPFLSLQEANMVEINVVQRQATPLLTEGERSVFSAFVNDMLKWCAADILRTTDPHQLD